MGAFGLGLGKALGAAGLGATTGQNRGEAEAYRRSQQQQSNLLRSQLYGARLKPPSEEPPYDIKTILDLNQHILGPAATAEERNQYYASGQDAIHQAVVQAIGTYGNDWRRVRQVAAIVGLPVGDPRAAHLTHQFHLDTGNPSPFGEAGPPGFIPAGGPSTIGGVQVPAAAYAGQAEDISFPQPQGHPEYQYTPGAKETAETERIRAETADIPKSREERMRRLNFDVEKEQFDQALALANYKTNVGYKDFDEQVKVWESLLRAGARSQAAGNQSVAKLLAPLLFNQPGLGRKELNVPVAKAYLRSQKVPEDVINEMIGGATTAGGGGAGVAPGGQTPGAMSTGGPPQLPPATTANPQQGASTAPLEAVKGFVQSLGLTPGSGMAMSGHNPGSAHYEGRALDVPTRGQNPAAVDALMSVAGRFMSVSDERTRPAGQKVWTGPHIHLEWPAGVDFSSLPTGPGLGRGGGTGPSAGGGTIGEGQEAGPIGSAVGIKTPATAEPVRNPYPPGSFEARIFNLHVQGRTSEEIQAEFDNTPYARTVARVIEDMQAMQRGHNFTGVPVPGRMGAEPPNVPSYQGIGYPEAGFQPGTTSPAPQPNADFGAQPQRTILDIQGQQQQKQSRKQEKPATGQQRKPPRDQNIHGPRSFAGGDQNIHGPRAGGQAGPKPAEISATGRSTPSVFGIPGGGRGPSVFGRSPGPGGGAPAGTSSSPATGDRPLLGIQGQQGGTPTLLPSPKPPRNTFYRDQIDKAYATVLPRLKNRIPLGKVPEAFMKQNGITDPIDQYYIYDHVQNDILHGMQRGHTLGEMKAQLQPLLEEAFDQLKKHSIGDIHPALIPARGEARGR